MQKESTNPLFPSFRLAVILLVQVSVTLMNCCIGSMSFAIVCMTNSSYLEVTSPSSNNSQSCTNRISESDSGYQGTLQWSKEDQALVLLGVPIGSIFGTLPLAYWLGRYGVKRVAGASMLLMSITTILTPVVANYNLYLLLGLRIIFGFANGVIWPYAMTACVQWAPKQETGRMIAFTMSGIQIGFMISLFTSGFICSTIGWKYTFYIWGSSLFLWALLFITVYKIPSKMKGISPRERNYIESGMAVSHEKIPFSKLPIRALLTSVSIWVMAIHCATTWFVGAFMDLFVPTYLKEVLMIPSQVNGIVSAAVMLGQFIGRNACGIVMDKVFNRFGDIGSMKICAGLCSIVPAMFLAAMCFVDCSTYTWGVFFTVASSTAWSFCTGSFVRGPSVIAPRYTSHLIGLFTTGGYVIHVIEIMTVGLLTTNGTLDQWRKVFIISISVAIFGGVAFMLLVDKGKPELSEDLAVNNDAEHNLKDGSTNLKF